MGVLREADSSWYMREENGGLLLGPYEKGAPCCYVDGPSDQSEYELFQEDLDRLAPHIETAIARVPAFGEVGIKKVYNGAIAYTPDGSPIIGPAWDLQNFWLNEGHSFGVTAAGGAGWQLAEWIVEGEPTIDMMGVDPRRFGPYATRGYLKAKNEEAYANVFTPHYPDEERAAARPLKRTPCYDRMKELGAVFGSVYGWERPGWFAPKGYALTKDELDQPRRAAQPQSCSAHGGWPHRREVVVPPLQLFPLRRRGMPQRDEQCRPAGHVGLRQDGGLGAGRARLARLDPRQPHPEEDGPHRALPPAHAARRRARRVHRLRMGAGPLLSRLRRRLERHDHDYLRKLLPDRRLGAPQRHHHAARRAGPRRPNARKVLQKLTDADLSNEAFPWLSGKEISVGHDDGACAARQLRRRTRLGVPPPDRAAERALRPADGGGQGIRHPALRHQGHVVAVDREELPPRAARAVDRVLRLESGLDRFVHPNKGQFIGRDALVAGSEKGLNWNFVTMEVHGVTDGDSDARGSEPLYRKGKLIGRATNGGFGFRVNKSLALGMVQPESRPSAPNSRSRSSASCSRRP